MGHPYSKNREAALQTLADEGVTLESFFLFELNKTHYLIGYMRAASQEKAEEAVKHSLSDIDAYHQAFKNDSWLRNINTELLIDLSKIDNERDPAHR